MADLKNLKDTKLVETSTKKTVAEIASKPVQQKAVPETKPAEKAVTKPIEKPIEKVVPAEKPAEKAKNSAAKSTKKPSKKAPAKSEKAAKAPAKVVKKDTTFSEAFTKVAAKYRKADVSKIDETIAAEIDVFGSKDGTFYIEIKDGNISIEPYDYVDKDINARISFEDFVRISEGKLDVVAGVINGSISVDGNFNKALLLKKIF
ncbi:MAG: SCP2 sterol-binding domain-containing protein [Oscillospiraceae bacterium]